MDIGTSFATGAIVGLSIAAPIGPTSLFCVQRTLGHGFKTGITSGLAIATIHLGYGILAALTVSMLQSFSQQSPFVPMLASLILMAFALRTARSEVSINDAIGHRQNLGLTYWTAMGFGLLNPFTPILFAASSPKLATETWQSLGFVGLGVFLGSLAWWLLLLGGVSCFRRMLPSSFLSLSNKITGVFLGVMAIQMFAQVCMPTR